MNLNNGIQHLKKSDKLLKEIINQYPAPSIKKSHNYFQSLIKYIIYQQLSTKSASVIYDRFIKSFDTARLTPDHIFSITKEELKLIGLSRQKKQYIFLLAENWSKTKNKLKNIELLNDDRIAKELMMNKGIGQWTVDMFLIFSLNRPDILPLNDLVIQKGYAKLTNMDRLPTKDEIKNGAEKWKPYRTLASLYLWNIIDGPFEW